MEVIIYRNIQGDFHPKAFEWWKSFTNLLGFRLDENTTKNTNTITVYQDQEAATFTIFHTEPEPHLCLNYLRLEPANPQLAKLIDSLIQRMGLSGEKHIIDESIRISTFFIEGEVVSANHNDDRSKFNLLLLRETILGFVHLSLDRMIEFQCSGNLEGVAEIKGTLSHYQTFLTELNEQIDTK